MCDWWCKSCLLVQTLFPGRCPHFYPSEAERVAVDAIKSLMQEYIGHLLGDVRQHCRAHVKGASSHLALAASRPVPTKQFRKDGSV